MKKKLALIMLMLCLGLAGFAQKTSMETEKEVYDKLNRLANRFCKCLVDIGSTESGLSENERIYMKDSVVPTLFIKYKQRIMKLTGGKYGTIVREKKMQEYFEALKKQSEDEFNTTRKYEIVPEIITNKDGIVWKKDTIHADGTIQEYATIILHQTYSLRYGRSTDRGWKTHIEVDHKEIKVIRIIEDGDIKYGLGDVTKIERMETINR
jgi:hypothetical protein